jgi:sec-independent protein translocase protein TatA
MWKIGWGEGLLILAILLLLFGANKLPAIGRGLGEGIKNFRNSFRSGAEGEESEGRDSVKKKNS